MKILPNHSLHQYAQKHLPYWLKWLLLTFQNGVDYYVQV
ncbi:hypothetical protein SPONN_464 [uncultured Candidatus Thioglobus sp.]|nr:hypothetical protein SPONN_464 [uncultured Candidatus Thioglobus sp.]